VPTVDEYGVRTLLRSVADGEVPPARVDLDQAIAGGRRQRRRWAVTAAGSGLAIVLAAGAFVAATVSVNSRATTPPQARPTATGTAAGRTPAMPGAAPSQFNPLTPYAEFGWLPGGYTVGSQGAGPESTTRSVQMVAATANGSRQIQLMADAAGACTGSARTSLTCPFPDQSALEIRAFRAAPAVNGRSAYWAQTLNGDALVWQYAPDAWASLNVWGPLALQGADTSERAMLRRIAAGVRYGADPPVSYPFWIRLPAGWTVGDALYQHGPGDTWFGAGFQAGPANNPLGADLVAGPGTAAGECKGTPNTTLDGAPATLQEPGGADAAYQDVCAADVHGLHVYVALDLNKLGGQPLLPGGALGLARELHLLGTKVWTTKPVR
jgi:hypothetical protein